MVPAVVLELLYRTLVGRLELARDLVLVKEFGHALVESGIIGIPVELAAIKRQRLRRLPHRDQARDVAVEHARIFRRARTVGDLRSLRYRECAFADVLAGYPVWLAD